jgi:TPR repeat protein
VQGDQYFQQKNYAAACSYYQISSDNGDVYATRMLAECYIRMDKNNHPKAVKYYKQLADQGDKDALYRLGDCYMKGIGVKKNESEAFSCYVKAANLGHIEAQYKVALCYEKSKGVTHKNLDKAHSFYVQAANNGHILSQCKLGDYYMKGQGGTIDLISAYNWYLKAAEEGHADAQFNVGKCIDKGVSSRYTSKYWYEQAAEQGHSQAARMIDTKKQMSYTSVPSRNSSTRTKTSVSRTSSSSLRSKSSRASSSSSRLSASATTSTSTSTSKSTSASSKSSSPSSCSSSQPSTSVVVYQSKIYNDLVVSDQSTKSKNRTPYSLIKNEFYQNYGKYEFNLFGGSITAGQGIQISASSLGWRLGWFLINPLECTLIDDDYFLHPNYFDYEIYYQPTIGFLIPCNDFSGVYLLGGPSINIDTFEYSYKFELGYRLHFGFLDLSRADIFLRYDGTFTAGISYRWSLGFGK